MRTAPIALAAAVAFISTAASPQSRVLRLHSQALGEDRVIHVHLPANYAIAEQRYQVIYLLDGHVRAFFDGAVAAAGYDLVADAHDYRIPPQIIVAWNRAIGAPTCSETRTSSATFSPKSWCRSSIDSFARRRIARSSGTRSVAVRLSVRSAEIPARFPRHRRQPGSRRQRDLQRGHRLSAARIRDQSNSRSGRHSSIARVPARLGSTELALDHG